MKRWDAFISHASEDKETVALPLAAALKRAGILVWLDQFELRVGDSLREKIDEGLAQSRFGIVILSSSFLAKGWPKRELNGLFALEEGGRKVILPVWHEITKATLAEYSPILADRLAAQTSRGMNGVALELLAAILDPVNLSPSAVSPGLAVRFAHLLDNGGEPSEARTFLELHPEILRSAVGAELDATIVWKSGVPLPANAVGVMPDLAIGRLWRTTGRRSWEFLIFLEPDEGPLNEKGEVSSSIAAAIQSMASWREWVGSNRSAAAGSFRDITLDFPCTIVVGRRNINQAPDERLAELNDALVGTRIRTYEWLIEAAAQVDERRGR